MKHLFSICLILLAVTFLSLSDTSAAEPASAPDPNTDLSLENQYFKLGISKTSGAITSFVIKQTGLDMIGEKRLAANFRICLPLDDYLSNYIDGMNQKPVSVKKENNLITVCFSGLSSEKGTYPIDLSYTIALVDEQVRFASKLRNNSKYPVSEFWFPRLGGWTQFGPEKNPLVTFPDHRTSKYQAGFFKYFPAGRSFGTEAAEFSIDYPGWNMVMPWWELYDAAADIGLYLGYHDKTFRYSTWHMYLYPTASGRADTWLSSVQAAGEPVGLVFSHVRYPFIKSGETFESGEFIIRLHKGDWHYGSKFYREWFLKNFPFDKSKSWLRKKSAWFTSIIYQPEDRIVADYKLYDQWCRQAQDYGISCFELIGWDSGGLERNYPRYVPEEKLGGKEGFRTLLKSIDSRNGKCLVFVNYNVLDSCTDWYKKELHKYTHQDQFGNTPNWLAWGESTLIARRGLSVRRHLISSVVPPMEKILEDYFLQLVKDGAHGFQIDKVCAGSALDFNPLNTAKPDVALCEGLVQSIGRVLQKCRQIDPDFCLASESVQDRLIPYVDVYYRSSTGFSISPLRYVFPEWTSCQHVSAPYDFKGVNGAILTGSVIVVEPDCYQNSLASPIYKDLALYIKEVERIRNDLKDIIFLGSYFDTLDAKITEVIEKATAEISDANTPPRYEPADSGQLLYAVHGHTNTGRRAIVVTNASENPRKYLWEFLHKNVTKALLYEPFEPVRTVLKGSAVEIKSEGLQILVEPY